MMARCGLAAFRAALCECAPSLKYEIDQNYGHKRNNGICNRGELGVHHYHEKQRGGIESVVRSLASIRKH